MNDRSQGWWWEGEGKSEIEIKWQSSGTGGNAHSQEWKMGKQMSLALLESFFDFSFLFRLPTQSDVISQGIRFNGQCRLPFSINCKCYGRIKREKESFIDIFTVMSLVFIFRNFYIKLNLFLVFF